MGRNSLIDFADPWLGNALPRRTLGRTALLLKADGDLILRPPVLPAERPRQWNSSLTSTARFRCVGCFPYVDPKHSLAGIAVSTRGAINLSQHTGGLSAIYQLCWSCCKARDKLRYIWKTKTWNPVMGKEFYLSWKLTLLSCKKVWKLSAFRALH